MVVPDAALWVADQDGACGMAEACRLLGLSRSGIYRLRNAGKVCPVKCGGKVLFSRRQIAMHLAKLEPA